MKILLVIPCNKRMVTRCGKESLLPNARTRSMFEQVKGKLSAYLWGGVGGIVLTLIVGFTWGGLYTAPGAQKLAQETATEAVNATLLPFCATAFVAQATPEQKAALISTSSSYEQANAIGSIVKLPNVKEMDYKLRSACADEAVKLLTPTAAAQG